MKKKVLLCGLIIAVVLSGCGKNNNQYMDIESGEPKFGDNLPDVVDTVEDTEGAAEEAIPADAVSAYRIFLGMYGDATLEAEVDKEVALGYSDYEYEHAGEKLTFEQLCDAMKNSSELDGDYDPVPYYSYIEAGDNTLLAVKFQGMNIYSENDDSFTVLIFNYKDGTLHITDSFDSWARNTVQLYENGLIESSGSAGAGEMIEDAGVLSEEGKYQMLFSDDCCIGDWIGSATSYDVYSKFYDSEVNIPGIELHGFTFDDETVWSYVGLESKEINSTDKEFLAAIDEIGFKIVDMDTIESKIDEKANSLIGDSYGYSDACPATWNTIYKDGLLDITPKTFGETSKWNYKESFYSNYQADEETLALLAKADNNPFAGGDILSWENAKVAELENSETEQYLLVKTVGSEDYDDYFKLYMTNDNKCAILAPDGGFIRLDYNLCDLIYGTVPELYPCDFDDDGEIELGIITYIFHGTGFSQKSLIILNKFMEGSWEAVHLTPQNYIQVIGEHLRFIDNGSDIEIIYNGDSVDTVSRDNDSQITGLYYDDFVDIEFSGKDIIVRSNPVIYSEDDYTGLVLGTAKLTYSLGKYGDINISDFEYFKEADSKKLLSDYDNGMAKDSNGDVVIYHDKEFDTEELDADIAYVDINNDGDDDLIVRMYGGYIPYVYSVNHGEIRCVSTYCFGSSSPTIINSKHQIVHQDIYHANRQQYGVVSYSAGLNIYPEIFFSDWYENEDEPSSHEYMMVRNAFGFGDGEGEGETITESEFEELKTEYLQEDKSIVWEKRD